MPGPGAFLLLAVPDLTCSAGIKLNDRVRLPMPLTILWSIQPHGSIDAAASGNLFDREGRRGLSRKAVTMSLNRIHARERRLAAVREAGHVVIARWIGVEIMSAWIAPYTGETGELTWIGQIRISSMRGADKFSRRMVGVAGSVAEHLWRGEWIEDYSPEGSMSETDWLLAGCVQDIPDDQLMDAAGEVSRILARGGPGWQALIAETRRLIVSSRWTRSHHRHQTVPANAAVAGFARPA